MLIKKTSDMKSSEITEERLYRRRREFIGAAATALTGLALSACTKTPPAAPTSAQKFENIIKSPLSTGEKQNSFEKITSYNNFYEFGTEKDDPGIYANSLVTRPWTVAVAGEVDKPQTFDLDDLLKLAPLEERIYRLRCVEGWSMVIPWVGFPLNELIKRVEPNAKASFVEFLTLQDSKQMPGQKTWVLNWPYREGLRLDEAMHPLTILAVGLYGQVLPNQNGAPIRLVVPWKYGFKSIKSIVSIRFVTTQPATSWNQSAPDEYGFYSNVNPQVDHPRWSQAKERRLPELFKSTPTQMFNGYADQVAHLYNGMDLRKDF